MSYDLIVIGGGPAGYLACERAGQAGLNSLLIEDRFIGGVCLNEGCIPSKTLLHSAKIYDYARNSDQYGVTSENVKIDHKKVIKRKNKVVRILVGGVKAKLKANNVDVISATGKILGKNQISGDFEVEAGEQTYQGKNLLIATGSAPIMPPIPGAKEGFKAGFVLTNREILDLETIPEELVIIGGGVIGLEMASYFNSVGSKTTVIEMLDHVAGQTDSDIASILLNNYRKKDITFQLESKVTKIKSDGIVYENNGQEKFIAADKVLMSIGRTPNVNGIGLENIGVEFDRSGIKVDQHGKTNVTGVYAAGDVNGKSLLAHTAYREAEVCINNLLGKQDIVHYNTIASVIYTNPEVASIGETEQSASKKGIEFEMANLSMRYSGRYVAENDAGDGICKVLVDKKNRNIIGVHMIGNYSSEIIFGAAILMEAKMKINDIKEIVFPHPTVSEILRESVFEF